MPAGRTWPGGWRLGYALVVLAACAVFIRTAWISDDALITLRSVLNLIHGAGPVYHVGERVQSFTHASWFGLIAAGTVLTGQIYATLIGLSLLANGLTLWLLARLLGPFAIVTALLLLLSKSFVDYANSGLENPLSFLLIGLAVAVLSRPDDRRKWALMGLICGLLILTRPDLGLMLIAVGALNFRARGIGAMALGLIPLFAWEAFSLFYYGTWLPNSALAKLNTGLPKYELILQGFVYFGTVIVYDTLSFVTTALFLVLAWRSRQQRELALFTLLYLAYILWVGGDFMGGRFFSVPFFAAALGLGLMLQRGTAHRMLGVMVTVIIVLLGPINLYPNFIAGRAFDRPFFWFGGVADERGFYNQRYGLLNIGLGGYPDVSDWSPTAGPPAELHSLCGGLGGGGLKSGPDAHILDHCGLSDPLIARLPAQHKGFMDWRVGHFYRRVPEGYEAWLRGEIDALPHAGTQLLHRDVTIATRGPLWDSARIGAIWRLHMHDYGLDEFYANGAAGSE